MNIFAVDNDPVKAALQLHDRHVVKMVLESAQMLSTTQRLLWNTDSRLYGSCYESHPSTQWVGRSKENYLWLLEHFNALCKEYTYRYNRKHKSERLLEPLMVPPKPLQSIGLTPFALVMPKEFIVPDPVQSYRNYYIARKIRGNRWTNRREELDSWLLPHIELQQFKNNRITLPNFFTENEKPSKNEYFVFGSNLAGRHGKGAANDALRLYGARYGQGVGIQGRSYAIPTKDHDLNVLPLEIIKHYIVIFVDFTKNNPHLKFFITKVGCGLAGYRDEEVAPLFKGIGNNCRVSADWYKYL